MVSSQSVREEGGLVVVPPRRRKRSDVIAGHIRDLISHHGLKPGDACPICGGTVGKLAHDDDPMDVDVVSVHETPRTAVNGVATKTVTGQLAGSVTMEATATGLTTGTLGAFTVVHGAATQIALSGATTNLSSGATRVLTATIQDAAGNTVSSDSTTVVAFAKASGAGTVSGTGNATASNGTSAAKCRNGGANPFSFAPLGPGNTAARRWLPHARRR